MTVALPFGAYLVRVAVPVTGVIAGVALLSAAAMGLVLGAWNEGFRLALFAAGVLSWMFGIGWGTIANAKPHPHLRM